MRKNKRASVVITPEQFEDVQYRERVMVKVRAGLESAATEPTVPIGEARRRLKSKIRAASREG